MFSSEALVLSRAVCIAVVDTTADFGRVPSYDGESRHILFMSAAILVRRTDRSCGTYLMQ